MATWKAKDHQGPVAAKVLAEDDEDGFWDHWGRLKTKTLNTKGLHGLAEDDEMASAATE